MKRQYWQVLAWVLVVFMLVVGGMACGRPPREDDGGLEEAGGGNGTGENGDVEGGNDNEAGGDEGDGDAGNENEDDQAENLVMEYYREGGIAGFCDRVRVYANGEVEIATCAADPPEIVGSTRLTEEQMALVEDWVRNLDSFDTEQKDDAVADAMSVGVEFHGEGEREATAEDIQAMQELAVRLLSQAPTQ